MIRKLATLAAITLTVAVSLGTATNASAAEPHGFGWCDGADPAGWTDATSVKSRTMPDGGYVELRYSPSAQCGWGKLINGAPGA